MNLHMVDLITQYEAIENELDAALKDVIRSGAFINGPAVAGFEKELGQWLGGAHVLGVGNGTDAIQVALMALDIGPGDEVITPAFTFVATAEVVSLMGATPVFADIEPDTFTIDPDRIEELITDRTRAIVPVHLFGQCADMDPILNIAGKHGLAVIEDTAQAIGSKYKGRYAGTMGQFGTLSFFPSKNLGTFGDGGGVISDDESLIARARLIANHGSSRKYHNEVVGINSRLDAIHAAILSVKLKHLDHYNASRREAACRYDGMLADIEGITVPPSASHGFHVYHQYTIRVDGGSSVRSGLEAHLKAADIPHAVYYPVPMHRLPVYADGQAPFRCGSMDTTEAAAEQVLSLPMHSELNETQQTYICDAIRTFMNG